MFGQYFYNKTIARTSIIFGSLFNEIYIGRLIGSELKNQKRVPIAYGSRQKYIARLNERTNLTDERVNIKLPRMSWEYEAPVYDSERQRGKHTYSIVNGKKIKSPVPYRIPLTLSIMTKNEHDALQIVEQILPFFKPSLALNVKPVKGNVDIQDKMVFTLQGINKEDNNYGELTENRVYIWTLSFEARVSLYSDVDRDTSEGSLIKRVKVRYINEDDEVYEEVGREVNPFSAEYDEEYEIVNTE